MNREEIDALRAHPRVRLHCDLCNACMVLATDEKKFLSEVRSDDWVWCHWRFYVRPDGGLVSMCYKCALFHQRNLFDAWVAEYNLRECRKGAGARCPTFIWG